MRWECKVCVGSEVHTGMVLMCCIEYSLGAVWSRDYGEMQFLEMPVHIDV